MGDDVAASECSSESVNDVNVDAGTAGDGDDVRWVEPLGQVSPDEASPLLAI